MQTGSWFSDLVATFESIIGFIPPEIAAAVAASFTAGCAVLFLQWSSSRRTSDARVSEHLSDGCVFLFDGRKLFGKSGAADRLIDTLPGSGNALDRLVGYLSSGASGVDEAINALVETAQPFVCDVILPGERAYELRGEARGGLNALILRDTSQIRSSYLSLEAENHVALKERDALRKIVELAPVLIWRRAIDGTIQWANQAYRDAIDTVQASDEPKLPALFDNVREVVPVSADSTGAERHRVSVMNSDGSRNWFEISQDAFGDGEILGFGQEADAIVRAESALKRFVETLTETFAHLPIGLAVFDRNRKLGLFNPAVTEILKLDPAWLATRPSLREFLEQLRENRRMPDQKDFLSWRRKLTALERDAEDASYEESWVLPNGQTLKVVGRPHPQGALAFLFEDVSAHVVLEQRYRSQIEMHRSILHKFHDAVAVFGPNGALAFSNTAFRGVWNFDEADMADGVHIARMLDRWQGLSEPSGVWRKLRDFATAEDSRAAWSMSVKLKDRRILQGRFAPLPDGSTLVSFADVTERERSLTGIREHNKQLETDAELREARITRTQDQIDLGLQAIADLSEKIARGGQRDLRDQLTDKVADLKILLGGLAPPTVTHDVREQASEGADLSVNIRSVLGMVATAAKERSVTIAKPKIVAGAVLPVRLARFRQILFNLLTDCIKACPSGGQIVFDVADDGKVLTLTATTPVGDSNDQSAPRGIAGSLLERIAKMEGGVVKLGMEPDGERRVLSCVLPHEVAQPAPLEADGTKSHAQSA